jgi:malto-oligosyltrehalose synthase/4-alpha-glucanotransferase
MYNPVSTYRIQFHKDFTLRSLEAIIPYLKELGIRTVYASPVFESVAGSMHGYDGLNPLSINPEIGTEEELRRVSRQLHDAGIGWLQDIVPNHMAFSTRNEWLMDVLKNGPESPFAPYFDIDWTNDRRLMVPVLGDTLENVIARSELEFINGNGYFLEYAGARYPLKPGSYPELPDTAALKSIADDQHYRLCHWQETDHSINYRRFFTVNGLICLNVQDEAVFAHVHQLVSRLVQDGVFDGLRIDHIDGLYDPTAYLGRLRSLCGAATYIVVEKILQPDESIPERWPIAGTTGYDFLGLVNNVLTAGKAKAVFSSKYVALSNDAASPENQAPLKKALILGRHMQGELSNLADLVQELLPGPDTAKLRKALASLLVHCPVYRFYADAVPLPADEANAIAGMFKAANADVPDCRNELTQLQALFLDEAATATDERRSRIAHVYRRIMQYTGPLMAKGVEDTLMYTYGRFIAHNDVGDSPERFGITVDAFHRAMLARQQSWPLTQNTTSTHDTKRGEDARAMLNALSHAPGDWFKAVAKWQQINREHRTGAGPDARDEYFLYQTLFATVPFAETEFEAYAGRLTEYLRKAMREGKRRSDWTAPDDAYEQAVIEFALALLRPGSPFLVHFSEFRASMLDGGITLALTQLILRMTCPGVPDMYQGTELWDLSLVDPDNRRPVDFDLRAAMQENLADSDWNGLWERRVDGRIKLWLASRLLRMRNRNTALFEKGHYIPLKVTGRHAGKLIAFARRLRQDWIVVLAPVGLGNNAGVMRGDDWRGTYVELPEYGPVAWAAAPDTEKIAATGTTDVANLLHDLPFAILEGRIPENTRSAGILMPISSLPGRFGVGDLGHEARRFARTLSRAGQRIWQLLPLNPVSEAAGFSPYSSVSTMAGNTLFISPERLAGIGLIDEQNLNRFTQRSADVIDYTDALREKTGLLDLAYERFLRGGFQDLQAQIAAFAESEREWLIPFALYTIIRNDQENKPWYEWPDTLKAPASSDVRRYADTHAGEVRRIIWEQALFNFQWQELRDYCNSLGIELIGDLPFYVSYDSADVWANQSLFSLDEGGSMTGVSGVPPDYFSETGQLWGMPTFNWERHRAQDYSWWIGRLRRNLELYDALRIDHFRALAEYWEVPAGEATAVNGKWLQGPGTAFFDAVRSALKSLPFVAEDLGDNMEKVYDLRNAVALPGMKVVQFAFGDNMPQSVDAPHNYTRSSICYTGTHDNNTTLGWFRRETKASDRKRIEQYVNRHVTEDNVVDVLSRLALGSVSQRAILPMQDVLQLDERYRMNTPSSGNGNWRWRMLPGAFDAARTSWLLRLTGLFNRL